MAAVSPGFCGFDRKLARHLALASARAYESGWVAHAWLDEIDADTDTRVFIEDAGDFVVIAFRGTVDLENWLLDLDVHQLSLGSAGKIHAGFSEAVDALLPRIMTALAAARDWEELKPIYVTGHSLGGALASLAAFFLSEAGFPIAGAYTFASPRVGNGVWRATYDAALGEKTFRVCAAGDLVPLLPGLIAGYRHVGQEIFLSPGDEPMRMNPTRWFELARDAWRVGWALADGDVDFVLQAHSLDDDYLPFFNPDQAAVATQDKN